MDINNYSDNENPSLYEGKRRGRMLDIIISRMAKVIEKQESRKIEKLMNDAYY